MLTYDALDLKLLLTPLLLIITVRVLNLFKTKHVLQTVTDIKSDIVGESSNGDVMNEHDVMKSYNDSENILNYRQREENGFNVNKQVRKTGNTDSIHGTDAAFSRSESASEKTPRKTDAYGITDYVSSTRGKGMSSSDGSGIDDGDNWRCVCETGFLPPGLLKSFGGMESVVRMSVGQCYHKT